MRLHRFRQWVLSGPGQAQFFPEEDTPPPGLYDREQEGVVLNELTFTVVPIPWDDEDIFAIYRRDSATYSGILRRLPDKDLSSLLWEQPTLLWDPPTPEEESKGGMNDDDNEHGPACSAS